MLNARFSLSYHCCVALQVYDHLNVNLTEADRLLPLFSKKSGKDKVFYQ